MKTYHHNGIKIMCNEDAVNSFNMTNAHFHNEYELYYLLSGSRLFFIKDKVYPMVAGCLAFIDGEEMHRVFSKSDKPHRRFIVCIEKQRMAREFPSITQVFARGGCVALNSTQQAQTERLIRNIVEECDGERLMRHEYIELLIQQLLIDLFRQFQANINDIHYGGANIIKILLYIDDHYTEKITLESLSEHLSISVSHLTRLFKSSTGYTLVEYINNLRIKEAAKLLVSTSMPISQIALEVGFSSFSYFGKLFSECYNMSPMKYRKQG